MATGTTTDVGGSSYADRAYSLGSDALTAYLNERSKEKDLSAQLRIIQAQAEQDRITNATSLAYKEKAQAVDVKTPVSKPAGTVPTWAMWAGGGLLAALGVLVVYKVAK